MSDDDKVTMSRKQYDKFIGGIDQMEHKVDKFLQTYREKETAMKRELQFAHDAAEQKDDKVLQALDALSRRMDAIERGQRPPPDNGDGDGLDDDDGAMLTGPTGKALFKKDGDAVPGDPGVPHSPLPPNATAAPGEGKPSAVAADSTRRLALSSVQSRYDSLCMQWGTQAERPLDGERVRQYRERLLRPWMKYHTEWKDTDISRLDRDTFRTVEAQVIDAAREASRNPPVLPGTLHEIMLRDTPSPGHTTKRFVGSPMCWMIKAGARPGVYAKLKTPGQIRAEQMFGAMLAQQPT